MGSASLDIESINEIINNIIGEIGSSRREIFDIVDSIRNEQDRMRIQLEGIRKEIAKIIHEVDKLEKQDKIARKRLVEVSSNFSKYKEEDIRAAYDESSDIMIKLNTKRNEEKLLRERRDSLELYLKRTAGNIEKGEKVIGQVSMAMSFLEGDILSILEGSTEDSEMFLGIKILEAQENERKRIARDIHDGPAQYMANLVMKVDICNMIIQKNLLEGLKELDDLKESVKVALKEVRRIIFGLRPMSLDDLGLNQTIQQIVNSIEAESEIKIDLKLKPVTTEIESIIQVAAYRIIQEVFNNIRKHSHATNVEVKLDYGTKYLILIITDNGVGFNVEETLNRVKSSGTSYGLIGIYERVNQLQGEIEIKSSEGVGTNYIVRLPVNREVIKDESRSD